MDVVTKNSGFTLTEWVITLILISILAASIYLLYPDNTYKLTAQTSLLANDIRYAQSLALTKGERHRLVIINATSYQITNNSGTAVLMPSESIYTTFASGVVFSAIVNIPSANKTLIFDTAGTPYINNGTAEIPLSAPASITLSIGSLSKTISITNETGRVSS